MDFLIKNIEEITQNAQINVYVLLYTHRNKKSNFAVALPNSMDTKLKEWFCSSLLKYRDYETMEYDPFITEKNKLLLVNTNDLINTCDSICDMLENHQDYKYHENGNLLHTVNLIVCDLSYKGRRYLLFSVLERSTERLLKDKRIILFDPERIEEFNKDNVFVINTEVDFFLEVLEDEDCKYSDNIVVINKGKFERAFNYTAIQKEFVEKNINIIDKWSFLENKDAIIDNKGKKYVYQSLSKIFADSAYLQKMSDMDPVVFKKTIMSRCKGKHQFKEQDFRNNMLIVNDSNLEIVMKMLMKHFRFDFFNDSADLL